MLISRRLQLFKLLLFCIAVAAAMIAIWWWEGASSNAQAGRTIIARLIKYTGDAALITFPFLLLPPKFRWTILIYLWVIATWSVGSIWYFRFWGDLPGISSLLLFSNVNTELARSVEAIWKPTDLLVLLLPTLLTAVYIFLINTPVRTVQLNTKTKWITLISSLALFCGSQTVATHIYRHNIVGNDRRKSFFNATQERIEQPIFSNINDLAKNGPIIHTVRSAIQMIKLVGLSKPPTAADLLDIDSFIASSPHFPTIPDSLAEANRNKNIILILVESLNSEVVEKKVEGEPVTPVLQRLLNAPGTLSALNVMTQVRTGGSGDGQLIINTGLHPLSSFSTAIALGGKNRFPALPEAFGKRNNVVVFADDASAWNERETFSNYGFETIYTHHDYEAMVNQYGGDGAMFRFAAGLLPQLQQPFFMELLTVSMHTPFNDATIPDSLRPEWENNASAIEDDTERAYLSMVKYFDTQLGIFIESLSQHDLIDNTLLVVVSDHSQELTTRGNDRTQEEVFMTFIAANCGITERVGRMAGQVDVYPSLLNLTGTTSLKGWRGAGTSILDPSLDAAVTAAGAIKGNGDSIRSQRLTEAQTISELILRTDYFHQPESLPESE